MSVAKLSSILCLFLVSSALGQQVSERSESSASPGLVRVANTPTLAIEGNVGSSTRRAQPVVDLQSAQQWDYEPVQVPLGNGLNSDTLSFNATQPKSKILINPDQFWTRKSRPVIDQGGEGLLGDPNAACDEWQGVCGCCGMKANPGHLGVRSLNSGAPCECVDNCCPAPRCKHCKQH